MTCCQGRPAPEAAQQMGEGGTEHQRADKKAEHPAEVLAVPARCNFHPHRVDSSEKETGDKARQQ